MTIPTCAQGNDRPIKVVTDQWLSDELKVYVLTTRLDPRTADLVGRLTQLDRSEPELSLFQVPSDYTFTQAPKLPLKLVIH
ncbi:MAG TPA: hypothetical protein VE077_19105 [Candidatus Methylomirabilis sp.]|nr:hypothetical protein [Candidatus Methylomirabilis sp.]